MAEVTALIFAQAPGEELDRCLRSVDGIATQTFVVYSAPNGGIHRDWNDAFDDLYNFGIEQVQQGWILHLNSDERLQDGAQKRIAKAIQSDSATAFSLTREERETGGRSDLVRLWKADRQVRYSGTVFPVLEGVKSARLDVKIFHTPILGSATRTERNIRLMRKELQLRPGQARYEALLAQAVAETSPGESSRLRQSAIERLLADSSIKLSTPLSSWLLIGELQSITDEELKKIRGDRLIRATWRLCANSPNAIWTIANAEFRRGDLLNALHAWMELDEQLVAKAFDPACPPDPKVTGAALYKNLAQAAQNFGRQELARRSLKRAAALDPHDTAIRMMLART